jgi:hypothetical protein
MPNLGAATEVRFYHDGRSETVATMPAESTRYALTTTSSDVGVWQVKAAVVGSPDCTSTVRFTVSALPNTDMAMANDLEQGRGHEVPMIWLLLISFPGCLAAWLTWRRVQRAN